MGEWEVMLDFAKNTTAIRKYKVELPFKESIPVIDIFDLPEILNRKYIPPSFRTFEEPTLVANVEESFQDRAEGKTKDSPYVATSDE